MEDALRQRDLEADLVTAVLRLDDYLRCGVPAVLSDLESNIESKLTGVLGAVHPSDLRYLHRVWRSLREAHGEGRPLSGVRRPSWVDDRGLGVGFSAPYVARRLLKLSEARKKRDEALTEAARSEWEVGRTLA